MQHFFTLLLYCQWSASHLSLWGVLLLNNKHWFLPLFHEGKISQIGASVFWFVFISSLKVKHQEKQFVLGCSESVSGSEWVFWHFTVLNTEVYFSQGLQQQPASFISTCISSLIWIVDLMKLRSVTEKCQWKFYINLSCFQRNRT